MLVTPKAGVGEGCHGAKGSKENQQHRMLNLQGGHLATISGVSFEGLQLSPPGHDLAVLGRFL